MPDEIVEKLLSGDITDEELDKLIEEYGDISEYIGVQVNEYKKETQKYENFVKLLFFTGLLAGYSIKKFNDKFDSATEKYTKGINKLESKSYKKIKNKMEKQNEKIDKNKVIVSREDFQATKLSLDKLSQTKAKQKYTRLIKNYYKVTKRTADKEYISKSDYLSLKAKEYDKIEKVVPYHYTKENKVVYHSLDSYNSMVYNTNLTRTAWNETIKACEELSSDLVYVYPHPFSCPLCQDKQGKIYSLSGKSKMYPSLDKAMNDGLLHPNCKHIITTYSGQQQTSLYTSPEWVERYDAKQKKQSLELERAKAKNDREVYKTLGNTKEVEKLDKKIKRLNSSIKEQKAIAKIK